MISSDASECISQSKRAEEQRVTLWHKHCFCFFFPGDLMSFINDSQSKVHNLKKKMFHTTYRFTGVTFFLIVVHAFTCSLQLTVLRELALQECNVIWKLQTDACVVHSHHLFFPLCNCLWWAWHATYVFSLPSYPHKGRENTVSVTAFSAFEVKHF